MNALRSTLLALLALGCAGTETGNPSLTSQLAVDAHSSDPGSIGLRLPGADVSVEEAWLSLGSLSLVEGSACRTGSARRRGEPLGSADHAGPDPAIATIDVDPGAYCAVGVTFSRAADVPPSAPAELAGSSIVLTGRLANGAAFSLVSAVEREISIPALSGSFELAAGNAALLVGFDVARWLSEVDLSSGEPDAAGLIRIDATNNAALLAAFEQALGPGVELYRDRDADAALDEDPELLGRGAP